MRHFITANSVLVLLMVVAIGGLWLENRPTMHLTAEEYSDRICRTQRLENRAEFGRDIQEWSEFVRIVANWVRWIDDVEPPQEYREFHKQLRRHYAAVLAWAENLRPTTLLEGEAHLFWEANRYPSRFPQIDPHEVHVPRCFRIP